MDQYIQAKFLKQQVKSMGLEVKLGLMELGTREAGSMVQPTARVLFSMQTAMCLKDLLNATKLTVKELTLMLTVKNIKEIGWMIFSMVQG